MRRAGAEKVRPAFPSLLQFQSHCTAITKKKDSSTAIYIPLGQGKQCTWKMIADLQQPYIQANETMQEMTGKSVLTVAG